MRNCFSQRIISVWNSLLQPAVEADSLIIFKVEMDRFLINQGVKDCDGKAAQWS